MYILYKDLQDFFNSIDLDPLLGSEFDSEIDFRCYKAFVQKRIGPNVVGPFGILQTLADALKFIFKEIIIPASADKVIFVLAPIITLT